MDQNLEVKPYSTSAGSLSEPAQDSDSSLWSEQEENDVVATDAEQTDKLEVYEFPKECGITDLIQHFYDEPYHANCRTTDVEAWNEETGTYILEFSVSDIQRILIQPEQLLFEDEEDTTIKVRRFLVPRRKVLVTSPKQISLPTLKKKFKSFGDIQSCEQRGKERRAFVITFTNAEDAATLASKERISLNPQLTIEVQLHEDASESHQPSAGFSAYELNRNMDMPQPADKQMPGLSSRYSNVTDQESLEDPGNVSDLVDKPPIYTHVEVCRFGNDNIDDTYTLLHMHFRDLFGKACDVTKQAHSYDHVKDAFRFDFQPQDIASLLDTKQMIDDEHEDTILTIKPKESGKRVLVRVVKNLDKVRLEDALNKSFGTSSRFASDLTIHSLRLAQAFLEMETHSVASLIVSIGQHKLDNIILTASFPAEDSQGTSAEPANNVVLVKGTASIAVVKKFMKSNSRGTLTKQLSPGQYLVEYESNEDANCVVEQKSLYCYGSELKVSFYNPESDPDSADGGPVEDSLELVLLVQTTMKSTVLKKYMKSEFRGSLTKTLGEDQYLVTFKTREDANRVVEQKCLDRYSSKVKVSFYNPESEPDGADGGAEGDSSGLVVLVQTTLKRLTLKKYMKSQFHGTLTKQLIEDQYLVEFNTRKEAESVVEKGVLKFSGSEIKVSLYIVDDEIAKNTELSSSLPTHIKVSLHSNIPCNEMIALLGLHFDEALGKGWPRTQHEHSYDDVQEVLRFDLPATDIAKLTDSPQYIDEEDVNTRLLIESCNTGKLVTLQPAGRRSSQRFNTDDLEAHFGPSSPFASTVNFNAFTDFKTDMEMGSCSVASRVASMKLHTLKNGMKVRTCLSVDQADSRALSDSGDEEFLDAIGDADQEAATLNQSSNVPTPNNTIKSESNSFKNLLVSNLVDVDAQTIYFWVKALADVWPRSIQLSENEEKAIVKIPSDSDVDVAKLRDDTASPDYQLHEETLLVVEVQPTRTIQVICSTSQAGNAMEQPTLEAYFSNAKYTGTSALEDIRYITGHNGLSTYAITYATTEDVNKVLQRMPYKHGTWTFDVAEYYNDIGVCSTDNLSQYPKVKEEVEKESRTPIIYVRNVETCELKTLKLYMSDRRRTEGGEIASWTPQSISSGLTSVGVVYKDPEVAERVYDYYRGHGLTFKKKSLEVELELPWLAKNHDDRKVRISALNEELDPEKLKFYLSALANNVVSEIFFNGEQTRAVALFRQTLDYGQLLDQYHNFPLRECPGLKIQQEQKVKELLATGNLTKEDIELPLENLLKKKFQRDVEVQAEEFHSGPNVWKITTEPEALPYVLDNRQCVPRCETLTLYTEYLGHQTTSGGTQKKEQSLSDFVFEPLMLHFLLNIPSGYQKLTNYLQTLGLTLAKDGSITISQTFNKKDNRKVLKNWRMLKQTIETFVTENFCLCRTDTLTQQVFDRVTHQITKLFTGQPVASDIRGGTQNIGNKIAIAGETAVVAALQTKLEEMISKIVSEIQEEKNVIQVSVPNILEYQLEYLKLINFFPAMEKDHKLRSIASDITKLNVTIHGRPASIDAVQKEMLELLSKLAESKISASRKPLFIKVFKTEFAEKSIRLDLVAKKIAAVWSLENRTIYVYSRSKDTSQKAMDCIDSVVWEAQYPEQIDFDDLEMKLLASSKWKDKKTEMQRIYLPLEVVELDDRQGLGMAGVMQHKASVLEDIPYFFDKNVLRTITFHGSQDRLLFLHRFKNDIFSNLETRHNVKCQRCYESSEIEITGTKDDVANFDRALKKEHNLILKEKHVVENEAMVQYINGENDFLENVGRKTCCLVVHHKEEVINEAAMMPATQHAAVMDDQSYTSNYSVTLPSGTVCEVKKGDLTSLTCDVIVNAANGDLQHVGGLAAVIVRKGGHSIQQECANYIRRNGKLMEGQVMTSSSGSLPCKKIIHAVGPRWQKGSSQEERTLFNCVDNCFEEVVKYQLQSIAIPPISTGIFGFPLDKAVKILVDAVANRESHGDPLPRLVIFADISDDSLHRFERELRARYGQELELPQQPAQNVRPVTAGKLLINGKTLTVLERVNIEIKKGDLSASQEDTLVNSVGSHLDLTTGKVSQAIAAKAGRKLQVACTALAPVHDGEVKQTDGFNLPCKKVLHGCCPKWVGPQSLQTLETIVIKCLKQAAVDGHQSIAFPALGTGNLSYPSRDVAQCMIEAVTHYVEDNVNSSIKTVKIIIFHKDKKTLKGFDYELDILSTVARAASAAPAATSAAAATTLAMSASILSPKRNMQPIDRDLAAAPLDGSFTVVTPQTTHKMTRGVTKDSLKGCVKVNNTAIRVIQGDITTHRADVLVNSTDGMLRSKGQVSQALLAKAGQAVQQEVRSLVSTTPVDGIWVSLAGDLEARFIFHIDASSKSSMNWSELISKCLKKCDEKEIRSIAFPAIGTGLLGMPPKEMAKIILESAVNYLDNHAQSMLERIDVVIIVPAMVHEFVQSMSNAVKKKDSLLNRFTSTISQWFTGSPASNISGFDENSRAAHYDEPNLQTDLESFGDHGDGVLTLDIYGMTKEQIQECKKELESKLDRAIETYMWSSRMTYEDDRANIGRLTPAQKERLHDEADKLHVTIYVDPKLFNIKIVGLNKNSYAMAEIVAAELKNIEKLLTEKKEEALIAKATQWLYEDKGGEWTKFDPSINKGLEDAVNAKLQEYSYDTTEGRVTIDLSEMEACDASGVKFEVKRNDLSTLQDNAVKPPPTWIPPLDTYGEHALVPNTKEYKQVEDDFMLTLGAANHTILEIKRVQNLLLYDHYITLRKNVAKRLGKKESEVETTPLWHGTNEDTVIKITSGIFDRALSKRAKHGCGNYFAKDSSYAAHDQYSDPNASGHKYVIQARVITGAWCLGTGDMKYAPYKDAAQIDQYDSVVDDPNKPFLFVVFRDASAYPEYIIKFQ